MHSLLVHCGVKPWEFGEMTFPWLKAIATGDKVEEPPEALEWKIRQAKANTKEFMAKFGKIGL